MFLGWAIRAGHVPLTYGLLGVEVVVTWTLYAGLMWSVRDTLMATLIDRRVLLLLAAALGGVGLLWVLCWLLGVSPSHSLALSSCVYVFFFVATTMAMERRIAWVTLALVPVAGLASLDPTYALEWQGVYVLVGGNALSLLWRRDARLAAARERDARGPLSAT
jgi:hypothetical protein